MLRRWDNNANVISKISGKIPLGHVFSDVNPIIGKSQYLLSLEKDDGGNVLSSAVDVFLLYDDEVTLYPNPVQNEMKVWVGRNNRDKLIVNIYSIDEKLVKETNILKTRPYIYRLKRIKCRYLHNSIYCRNENYFKKNSH